MRLLLVEDDHTTRTYLQNLLESWGYVVSAFADSESAFDAYQQKAFPIVLVDWLLPGATDGLDLCRRIRACPESIDSVVFVVTIRNDPEDLETVLDAGADDYLPKPIDPKVLRVRLRIGQERLFQVQARSTAERALHVSESRLRAVVTNAPLLLFMVNEDGVFTFAEGRGLSSLGSSSYDIVGRSVFEVYRGVPDIAAHISRALAGEEFTATVDLNGVVLESWYAPIERTDLGGQGVIIVATDVTKRWQVQEDLRDGEERLRRFAEAAFEGIAVIDEGVIIDANKQFAEMMGYGLPEIIDKSLADLVQSADAARVTQLLTQEVKGLVELTGKRRDGSQIPLEIRMGPIPFRGKEMLVAAVQDITPRRAAESERQRLEEQLRQTQKLESLGVLAGGIAHDFNNLLMGVLGNANLALMDLPDDTGAVTHIRQIEVAAQRAAELTSQMLAFSGKGRFVVERLNLTTAIAQLEGYLAASAASGVELEYELDEDIPEIEADTTQVRQILISLVANASDAMFGEGGTIRISTGVRRLSRDSIQHTSYNGDLSDGFKVYLEVRDTGRGMDEHTRARIFDPFFTTKFTGRGLGLPAVLGIVRGHKAAIKVVSQPNQGTTITVLFPPAREVVDSAHPSPRPENGQKESDNTVLIIDDEQAVRQVTSTLLRRSGFEVITADNGRDGIEAFRKHADRISVVLLDLTMPDVNGDEVFEEMQKIDPAVRVLLMSGYDQQEVTDRFGSHGLAGFLQKPFAASALKEHVHELLSR